MNSEQALTQGLDVLGLPCSASQVRAFVTFLAELKKWNRTHNLTAISTDRDIIVKHFLDSLLYLELVPDHPSSMADIGSGGGFPGIPIRIMRPDIRVTLIEPSRKKASFLKHIVRTLELDGITVVSERIENLAGGGRAKYDVVVSRATFSLAAFLEKACPCLRKGGFLVASKGPGITKEMDELNASPWGAAAVAEVADLELPFSAAKRKLLRLSCTMEQ